MSNYKAADKVKHLQSEIKVQRQLYSNSLRTNVEFEKIKVVYLKIKELAELPEESKSNCYIALLKLI